jgi:hypothetical protein
MDARVEPGRDGEERCTNNDGARIDSAFNKRGPGSAVHHLRAAPRPGHAGRSYSSAG